MKDIWQALEERTRAWSALGRQSLADAIWQDYVTVRFGRSGDPRALEYLYPYLNHHDTETRFHAIETAAKVFEGRGPKVLGYLEYFVKNSDHFLSDRAVQVVGAAMRGMRGDVVLDVLAPYLNHRNRFVRRQAFVELGKACEGQADERVLSEIQRVASLGGPSPDDVDHAIAHLYSGKATEAIYSLVVKSETTNRLGSGNSHAVAILVRNGSEELYRRATEEVFDVQLHMTWDKAHEPWQAWFLTRSGVAHTIIASPRKGMQALNRMLHLAGLRCPGHALFKSGPILFAGADVDANYEPLMELLKKGSVPVQRIAAVCMGRLMLDTEDEKTVSVLRGLCDSKNKALQSAALKALGMVARSSGDKNLRELCLKRMLDPETAVEATMTLGMLFQGSGHGEVFGEIRSRARALREQPVKGRQYSKPLAACYGATGLLFLGTGSPEPLEFLADALARPRVAPFDPYHWWAARSLVMTEFPESALGPGIIGVPDENGSFSLAG